MLKPYRGATSPDDFMNAVGVELKRRVR